MAAAGPLELRIDAKTYVSAEGKPVEIVRGLNCGLKPVAVRRLIGPSGCGKTTILHIAAGLDPNSTGGGSRALASESFSRSRGCCRGELSRKISAWCFPPINRWTIWPT